jgi:2-oxoisovalerate dehydrogenase E1 component
MPCGGYIQGGPYHSQSIEGFLAHCPGLKIALPSNAADAKALLKSAIEDPNPCIILEHKGLYRQRFFSATPEPTRESRCAFGQAHIIDEGEDLTVIAWGMLVPMVKEAMAKVPDCSIELIDLRTPAPIDRDTLIASVKKTGKVLIAGEAPVEVGLAAELMSIVTEHCFEYLDAPPMRLGAFASAVPYSKGLEEAVLPQPSQVLEHIRRLARY